MVKLLKYELLKNKILIIIFFAALCFIEVMFLSGTYLQMNLDNPPDAIGWLVNLIYIIGIIGYASMLPVAGIIILVFSINSFTFDISKRQGYTIFLTPNSPRMIIGSKLIISLVAAASLSIFFILTAILNFNVLKDQFAENGGFIEITFSGISEIMKDGGFLNIITGLLAIIAQATYTLLAIYFSVAISHTMLKNTKARGTLSFFLYLIFTGFISGIIVAVSTPIVMSLGNDVTAIQETNVLFLTGFVLYSGIATALFFATSALIEKKLSM